MATQLDFGSDQQADTETTVSVLVRQVTYEADGVISLELVGSIGEVLRRWEPGSHIDLVLPSGLIRQYSLCGDLGDLSSYKIAVLREQESRGGSVEIHETALVGREVDIRGPRNRFSLVEADRYLFVAGGIGVTPIIPMLQRAEANGTPWHLVYGGRSRTHMAFLGEIATRGGGTVELQPQDEIGLLDLDAIVSSIDMGTVVYGCGPSAMLNALEARCQIRGISDRLHLERFTVDPDDAADGLAGDVDDFATFEVELAREGVTIGIPPDRTVLQCVREVVPTVLFSCQEGYCGTCETRVIAGVPDHRDTYLTDEEHDANKQMMICVSRSNSPRLVLDV